MIQTNIQSYRIYKPPTTTATPPPPLPKKKHPKQAHIHIHIHAANQPVRLDRAIVPIRMLDLHTMMLLDLIWQDSQDAFAKQQVNLLQRDALGLLEDEEHSRQSHKQVCTQESAN